ncbi:MAG: TPM domain-containing protein [Sphingobium sp.]|nr:TPM domain-containing protein [Sphingobium sp.]
MAIRRILVALLALLLFIPAAAQADPTFPALTGRVVDGAHILQPDQITALDTKLANFEQSTKQQLVVATVPDLQGYEVSDYANRLFRAWKLGDKTRNDGVLLLVAPHERRMWIEVGYGLEGVLTDAISSSIYRNIIVPRFKAGDMPGGIDAGADEIMRVIQLPPEEREKLAAEAARKPKVKASDVFKAIIIVIVVFFFIAISAVRAASRGGRRYRHGGGVSPIVVWAASEILSDALRGGRGGGWGGGGSSWGSGGDWGGGGGFSGGGGSSGGGGAGGGW